MKKKFSKGLILSAVGAVLLLLQVAGVRVDAPHINKVAEAACALLIVLGVVTTTVGGKSEPAEDGTEGGTKDDAVDGSTDNDTTDGSANTGEDGGLMDSDSEIDKDNNIILEDKGCLTGEHEGDFDNQNLCQNNREKIN